MTSLQNLPISNNLQCTYKFKIHNFAKFTRYNFKVYKVYNLQQMNITNSKKGQRPIKGKNGKKN